MTTVEQLVDIVQRDDTKALAQCLATGTDPNTPLHAGETPLMMAARQGHAEQVELLLRYGADPARRDDNGMTAAEYATARGLTRIAQSLAHAPLPSLDQEDETFLRDVWGSGVVHAVRRSLDKTVRPQPAPKKMNTAATEVEKSQQSAPVAPPLIRAEELIGQLYAKTALQQIIALAQINAELLRRKLKTQQVTLHAIFAGAPGTGKTTFARYYAQEIRQLGLLKKGQLIEVSREQLVAAHVGGTAAKTAAVVESARGGVLFIDEAYSLKTSKEDVFGDEAIVTLLKMMEDLRDELIVILAGYTEPMRDFLHLNPGLKSRIPHFVEFLDFSDDELAAIFDQFCAKAGMTVVTEDRRFAIGEVVRRRKGRNFANAREVRNIFERAVAQQSLRLLTKDIKTLSSEELSGLVHTDFTEDPTDYIQDATAKTTVKPQSALQRLHALHGLANIKTELAELADFVRIAQLRRQGFGLADVVLHMIFTGNPGTGKTTVSRLLAALLSEIGLIPGDHLVQTDRSGLVAGYEGQTALKTRERVEQALGGILFIDQAHSLVHSDHDNYGQDALNTLLQCMKEYRSQLVVVLSGPTEPMNTFLALHPELQAAFPRRLDFADFSLDELMAIAQDVATANGYVIDAAALPVLSAQLQRERQQPGFANAQRVHDILEQAFRRQATRLLKQGDPAAMAGTALNTLESADFS
jgi:SpoVK/Ycf46/Vps4 family AAA+-type ATPase